MNRIIVLALAIAALSFVLADSANAACTQTGGIARIVTTPGSATLTTIYIRTSSLATIFYSATTTDLKTATMAAAAWAGNRRVQITGDAAACPAAGVIRPMGAITSLLLGP
jgi:hypothetical protein